MSDLNTKQFEAIADAYATLRAIFEVYKNDERDVLALHAADSMALLTSAFPQILELENAIKGEPR